MAAAAHCHSAALPSVQLPCEAASDSSECSADSWIHVDSMCTCCFLPNAYFTVLAEDEEDLLPARKLFQGAQVVAANGRFTEVAYPPEQHQVDSVIQLQAGPACLVVSPDHRILVPGNRTVEAKELQIGSEVILAHGTQAILTAVEWKHEPTIVLKIGFKPDLPVAAFMLPNAILSKGFRQRPFRRGLRRSPEPAEDSWSVPATEGHLTS
ncbi:unnamed protein product [Durusdinium trenchii]|uniref:Hint domain-containing protein n=1 Tax=Durusdinium trenchii TaxID=1381693 RepID=A0ABP0QYA5_9DINO